MYNKYASPIYLEEVYFKFSEVRHFRMANVSTAVFLIVFHNNREFVSSPETCHSRIHAILVR